MALLGASLLELQECQEKLSTFGTVLAPLLYGNTRILTLKVYNIPTYCIISDFLLFVWGPWRHLLRGANYWGFRRVPNMTWMEGKLKKKQTIIYGVFDIFGNPQMFSSLVSPSSKPCPCITCMIYSISRDVGMCIYKLWKELFNSLAGKQRLHFGGEYVTRGCGAPRGAGRGVWKG